MHIRINVIFTFNIYAVRFCFESFMSNKNDRVS